MNHATRRPAPAPALVDQRGAPGGGLARGLALAVAQRLLDLRPLEVVVHALGLLLRVGEHDALRVDHGQARARLAAELGQACAQHVVLLVEQELQREAVQQRQAHRQVVLDLAPRVALDGALDQHQRGGRGHQDQRDECGVELPEEA
jgi:hypothetical protein